LKKEEHKGHEEHEELQQQLMRGRAARISPPHPQGMPLPFFMSFVPFMLFMFPAFRKARPGTGFC
jgi:hypothetical protein